MAFAKQYFSSYKSNNNLDYYLEIWVDGYTGGNPTEIKLGAGGPVISYDTDQEDRFSPILSSQCELPFMVTGISTESFITLLRTTYQEKQVYLHLYRATSSTYTTTKPIWSGFLVMDLGSGEDVAFPYEQKLRFIDGLSLLKDIDFVDLSKAGSETNIQGSYTQDNMYYGPAIYTFWIKEILKKIGSATTTQGVSINYGFTTAVNWYNADMQNTNQGSDPLGLTQCIVSMFHKKNEQDVFTPENCYTVLKEILRHWGARITYWKHEFWIVQIPEYITTESGFINNPDNINSRQYDLTGSLIGSQDHLGDTFYTRYEQTIQSNQVSKIVGTKYNYLPVIHNVEADFLSFASQNYYGGFPFGVNAEDQEIFQGTIIDASTADFLWLSIPLNWVWDMSGTSLPNGHTNGWWSYVKFNFYASDGTSTYYLQYNSSNDSYYWVIQADWIPLGNTSPKYIIKSRNITETNYIGFEEQIPFVDSSGNAIAMTGAWSFFLDIEKFGTNSSNVGSFYCRFSGYPPSSYYSYVKADPTSNFPTLPDPSGSGTTLSGKVSWSNTLQNPSGVVATSFSTPAGFDAGTSQADIQLITSSPFKGFLQTLNTTQSATFGISLNTQIDNSTNTEAYTFGTLLWGDAFEQFAIGCLRVNNGSTFVKTNADGKWGRGVLTGEKTFTELLINEFLTGQIEVVISPTMRLAVGDQNKNQTASASGGGTAERPRYVNPIGILRETRNGVDPVYFFRRGSFYSLYDEWDYEGYQILRDSVTSTTTSNDIGGLGGSQDNNPVSAAKIIGNVTDALMMNSPVAYLRTNVQATGANVVVNGNFNVATGWVLGTGWSIDTTASKAKFAATGSLSSLSQINLTEGTKYQIIFTIDITAGQLSVKAGTSGGSQVITVSGQYEIYLLCGGSTSIEFQAGTTFTGSISQVSIAEQKSLSSVPIESLGEAVFKTNDTLNLVNSIGGDIIPLIVTSNQGATDTAISVTAVPLFDDIGIDSVLLINQDDLSAQYQNKTKGTVAGFDITATGIEKSSINITDWLNSDTMTGAAVTNVPTALSVKNYVDGQVGASDTLQEVTDNGNTTTNDVMIGSSSSPSSTLEIRQTADSKGFRISGYDNLSTKNLRINLDASGHVQTTTTTGSNFNLNPQGNLQFKLQSNKFFIVRDSSNSEKMRFTSGGNLLIGTTTDSGSKLQVNGLSTFSKKIILNSPDYNDQFAIRRGVYGFDIITTGSRIDFSPTSSTDTFKFLAKLQTTGSLTGTTATFSASSANGLVLGTDSNNSALSSRLFLINGTSGQGVTFLNANGNLQFLTNSIPNNTSGSEKMRLTSGGNLLLGTSIDSGERLRVEGDNPIIYIVDNNNTNRYAAINFGTNGGDWFMSSGDSNTGTNSDLWITRNKNGTDNRFKFHRDQKAFSIYSGSNQNVFLNADGNSVFVNQVTIPAIPVATTDAASKSYVDAHGGGLGPFLPLAGGTLTGGLTGTTATFSGDGTFGPYVFAQRFRTTVAGTASFAAIYLNSDSNSGLFQPSPDNIGFTTAGSEKMRLTSGGNLLLGTTTNGDRLTVSGNIVSYHIGHTTDAFRVTHNSNDVLLSLYKRSDQSNPDVRLRTNGNSFINGGNLGIGTTNPAFKTTIYSLSNTNSFPLVVGQANSANNFVGIGLSGFVAQNGAVKAAMILKRDGIFGVGDIHFLNNTTEDNSNAILTDSKLIIKKSGNLLIGTTSDNASKLQVTTNSVNAAAYFKNSNSNGFGVIIAAANGGGGTNAILDLRDSSDNVKVRFAENGGMTGTTGNFSGNVTVDNIVDSFGEILTFDQNDLIAKGKHVHAEFGLWARSPIARSMGIDGTATILGLYTNTTEKSRITSAGNFLIGSTSDNGQQLQVTGNIRITGGFQTSNTGGFLLADTGGSMRYGLKYGTAGAVGSSNLLMLTNRSLSSATGGGEVAISANASTSGVTETEVMRIKANTQSQVSIDGVLSLTSQNTPADPPNRASTIWLDSNFDLKIKITNNSGVTVTKTIVEYA